MSCWSLFKSFASLDELPSQSPVLQYTHFLNIMKPLYKMSIPGAVILMAAMELKCFQAVSISLHPLSPKVFLLDKLCFFSAWKTRLPNSHYPG